MSPEVERKLVAYLLSQEKADMSGALRRIFDAYQDHEAKDEQRHAEIRGDMRGLSMRVSALETAKEKLERAVEDTGRHEVVMLREKLEWWRATPQKVAAAVALVLFTALVTAVSAWVMRGK